MELGSGGCGGEESSGRGGEESSGGCGCECEIGFAPAPPLLVGGGRCTMNADAVKRGTHC